MEQVDKKICFFLLIYYIMMIRGVVDKVKKEYLNEETYQKNKKKVVTMAVVVLVVGILIGGSLIVVGIMRQGKINSQYSDDAKENISAELEKEKQNLETLKSQLEANGVEYDSMADYTDGDAYDLKIITKALDPSFDHCAFDEYKNNEITKEYCSLKDELETVSNDFNKRHDSFGSIPFYMFGGFAIVASAMIAGSIYMFAKRREITAFSVQQVMPVAQEGMEKMAPSMGNVAKEITKGVKEGLKDSEE